MKINTRGSSLAKSKKEELALAERYGGYARDSIARAITEPVNPVWDHHGLNAVRMARSACEHAFRARPDLRPPDNYELARREARDAKRKPVEQKSVLIGSAMPDCVCGHSFEDHCNGAAMQGCRNCGDDYRSRQPRERKPK